MAAAALLLAERGAEVSHVVECCVPGCSNPKRKRSAYCGAHRYRIERYGSVDGAPERPYRIAQITFAELLARETDECVLWPHTTSKGYGVIYVPKERRKGNARMEGVYVLACEHHHGPAPTPGHEVAHSCHQPLCMNYRHLRWATRRENVMDRVADGTHNRGEQHTTHRLTTEQVLAMRAMRQEGRTYREIGGWAGVSAGTARDCVVGATWAWLGEQCA